MVFIACHCSSLSVSLSSPLNGADSIFRGVVGKGAAESNGEKEGVEKKKEEEEEGLTTTAI